MSGPSPHLSWDELACHDEARTPYPERWRSSRAIGLAVEFEAIRLNWGKPIRILSGYRTKRHNRSVGGVDGSQHVQGRALDLAPPEGVPLAVFQETIVRYQKESRMPGSSRWSRIRGVGLYVWGCHVDTRPSTRLAVWGGPQRAPDRMLA